MLGQPPRMAKPQGLPIMAGSHTPLNDSPISSRRSSTTSKEQCETPASSTYSPTLSPSDNSKYVEAIQEPLDQFDVNNAKGIEDGNIVNLRAGNDENIFGDPRRRIDNVHILLFIIVFLMFKDTYAVLFAIGVTCLLAISFIRNMSAMTKSDGLVALHKTQTTAQSASKSVTVLSTTVNETNEGVVTTLYTQFGSIDTAFLFLSDSSLKSEVKLDNATKIIRDLKKELQFKDDQLHKKELKILGQDKLLNLKENRIKAKENRLRSNKETISSQNEKVGQLEIELSLKDKKIEKIGNELHKATHKLTDGDVELWPFMKKLRQARAPQKNIDEVVLDIFQKLASFRLDTKHTDVSLGIALKQMVGQILCTVEADGQDSYTPIPVDIMEKELVKYTYNVAWNNIIDAFVIKVRFQKPEDFKTLGQYRQEYLNAQQYEQFSTLPTPNKGSMATQTWYDKGMSILNSRFQWIETNTKHLYVGLVPAYKDSNDPSKGYKWQGHWAIWTGTAYKVFVWVQDRQIWYCETDEISICIEEDAVRFLKGNLHDPQMPPVGPKVWEGSETGPFWDRVASECEQQWEWEQERQTKEYEAWITQEQKKAQQEIQMRGFFNSLQNKRTAQDDADNQKKNQDFFTDLLNDFDDEIF